MQKEQKVDSVFLQEISSKTGLGFSKVLGAVVLEEIVKLIADSAFSKKLLLKNGNILSKEKYENHLTLALEYDYLLYKEVTDTKTTAEYLKELALQLIQEVFEVQKEAGRISLEVKMKSMPKYARIDCVGLIEDMQVPVSIVFRAFEEEIPVPKKESIKMLAFPKEEITYYCFPAETLLADKYIEIITKLELIPNVKSYYDVYYLLEHESVDGRKVRDYISEKCEDMQIPKDEKRMAMIQGYRDYTYMKKKWKVFLRSVHSKEPAWEQVIERFSSFFEPIWKAVMEDFVFFGDWMPELNRFL